MVGCKAARGAHDARQAADAAPGWRNQAKRPIRSREPTCKRHSGFFRFGRGSLEAGSPCRRRHGRGGAVRPAVAMGFDSPRAPTHFGRLESRVGQAPGGAEVAGGRFTWGLVSLAGDLGARPCRRHGGRPMQVGQREGGRSIQGVPIRRADWRPPRSPRNRRSRESGIRLARRNGIGRWRLRCLCRRCRRGRALWSSCEPGVRLGKRLGNCDGVRC